MSRMKKQCGTSEPTHYEVLGIGRKFTAEELQTAWRTKARECHPDKGGNSEAFAIASRAYAVLRDPTRRAAYDIQIGLLSDPCTKCSGEGKVYRQKGFVGRVA